LTDPLLEAGATHHNLLVGDASALEIPRGAAVKS
jgi:hypothetical protein